MPGWPTIWSTSAHILAGLLFVGLGCNLLVRPVNPAHYMSAEQLAREKALQHEDRTLGDPEPAGTGWDYGPAMKVP
ncbi:MAG: hypothetical protein ACLQFT_00580 [Steroidobacteraceae bacterium]